MDNAKKPHRVILPPQSRQRVRRALGLVVLLALFGAGRAAAESEPGMFDLDRRWTMTDTALQLTFAATTITDWAQTRWFLRNGWEESNPILGKHPSQSKVDLMIGGAIVGHTVAAWLLPKPFRTQWQLLFIGVEGLAVRKNYMLGIKAKF